MKPEDIVPGLYRHIKTGNEYAIQGIGLYSDIVISSDEIGIAIDATNSVDGTIRIMYCDDSRNYRAFVEKTDSLYGKQFVVYKKDMPFSEFFIRELTEFRSKFTYVGTCQY